MIDVDVPGEYARRLLNRIGDRDMFEVLQATPATLRACFDGVDDAAMRRPEAAGKWSMIEVAHHLADSEMVVGVRVRMILAEDRPAIAAYDQDLWVANLGYREAALDDVLAQFAALRVANLRLARVLGAAELGRVGIHSERGGESVGYTLRLQAAHDLVHLDQIARIRRVVA
jgi:DinB superfamily